MKSRIIILTLLCWLTSTAYAFTPGDPLYISDNLINLYGIEGAKQFTYNASKNLYSYTVAPGTVTNLTNPNYNTGDFALSTAYVTGTNMKPTWQKYVVCATGCDVSGNTTPKGSEIVPDGRSYTLEYANGIGSVSRWMSIDDSYDYQQGYTIYVKGDLSQMWVVRNLYASDLIVGNTSVKWNGTAGSLSKCFDYDKDSGEYILEIPAFSVANSGDGDIQLGTKPGDYDTVWTTEMYYVSEPYSTSSSSVAFDKIEPNTTYSLNKSTTAGTSHWMSVADYDMSNTYNFRVAGDLSSMSYTVERPSVYMSDLIVGNNGVYGKDVVKKMQYDEENDWYWYEIPSDFEATNGDFQFSLTPNATYDDWKKGLIWLNGGTNGAKIIPDGRRYSATHNSTYSNTDSHWQTVANYQTGEGYTKGYKFYVSGDFSEFWVEAEIPDLYLSDNISGQAISTSATANHGKKFKYDRDKGLYYYETTASQEVGTTGDFQISLNPGNYTEWKKGLLYIPGHDYTDRSEAKTEEKNINVYTTSNPNQYDLTRVAADNTDGHWMTINGWVHGAKDYIVYVSDDLSKVWVKSRRANVQPMYIIGHLVNNLRNGYDYHTANTSILPMEYDDENDYYKFTMAGARWSVFELSETAGPCAYNDWVDGMRAFMPKYEVATGDHAADDPVIQPVLRTNPFNKDMSDYDYITYPATKGNSATGQSGKRDMSIEGYNPDWLYTVYISGDKTKIWVTEQPINMPLKAMDFIDDSDINNVKAIPHYFVVGTRTADWRLLPEWEFKPGADATDMFISGRFMYDGYFAIAKVDNYLDYIHHRYQVFSNGAADQDYKIYPENAQLIESDGDNNYPLHAIALQDKGRSHALHYDEGDFANGTPIHDIHNSITWDIGVGATASQGGVVNTDMMRYALPFRFSRLTLTLDADGNPIQLQPTGSYNRKIINKYRTFVLMGSDINYEHEYDFNNCLGVRDVRAMTPAYQAAHTHELNWANSWISWDATHTPYYDAFQNTLFVTAYDKDWQNSALTLLDTEEGAGNWVEYSSDHMVFELADPNNDSEYGWVYRNHPSDGTNGSDIIGYIPDEGQEGTWDSSTYSWKIDEATGVKLEPGTGHYNVVSDFTPGSNTGYKYQERLANYDIDPMADAELHGNKLGDDQTVPEGGVEGEGWVCYVLKNVSFKGDFIVTSGWGGNLATYEGHGAAVGEENMPRNDLRLYFGNFSPRRGDGGHVSYDPETWAYTVRGFDLKTKAETEDASDNIKLGYRTYRDIDETNFCTQGTNYVQKRDESNNLLYHPDGTPMMTNTAKLQNYDRIILWYNTNVDRTSAEIPNGVIQFVQSSIAPNARMHLTPGSTNKFTVNWNIIDNTVEAGQTSDYADWGVVSYTIRRYRYVLSLAEGERNAQLYREFETVYPDNMTVDNLLSENMTFNDPYMLSPGSYFYTVEVTIQNPDPTLSNDIRTRTATTNTMTIAEPGKTASIDMEQVMTRDLHRNNLYTFNVKATTRLTSNNTILSTESSHETAVWKDAGYLEISAADDATLAALNNATSVEIVNKDKMQIWNKNKTGFGQNRDGSINTDIFKLNHTFDEDATEDRVDYIGWGLDPAYADAAGNPKFVDGKIRFIAQKHYWESSTKSYRYFTTLTLMKQCELPIIVWHNVKPNENVVGETADNNQYKLNVYLGPVTGANKVFTDAEHFVEVSLEDYWKTYLKFTPDDASTGVYAPAPQITMTAQLTKSAQKGNFEGFDHTIAEHIRTQPVGAHGNTGTGIVAQAPVHYTDLNEVNAHITTYIPVDNEVLENVKIGYTDMQVTNVLARLETPAVSVASGNYKDAYTGLYTSDIDATLHHLPVGTDDISETIKMGNETTHGYSHQTPATTSISYRLTNIIPKYSLGDVWEVSPANTKSVSADLDFTNLNALEFITDDHIFTRYTDEYLRTVSPDKPYGMRFFTGIEVDGKTKAILDNLYAYYGFNIEYTKPDDERVDTEVDFSGLGNHVQGGCPIYGYTDKEDYRDNWQGLWNPQGVDLEENGSTSINTDNFRVKPINGYSKYDGNTYSSAHNWSRLAAENNYLSVAYGPLAVSKNFEQVYWPAYKVYLTGYVTIPLIPYGEVNTYIETGAKKTGNMSPAPQYAPETTTSIIHGNIVPLTFQAPTLEYNKANIMTGIEGVETNDLEGAIFYNMQGVEVPNPQRGEIYIVKHRDGKVTREVYLR